MFFLWSAAVQVDCNPVECENAHSTYACVHVYLCTPLLPVLNAQIHMQCGCCLRLCRAADRYVLHTSVMHDVIRRCKGYTSQASPVLIVKREGQEPSPASHWWMSIVLIGSHQEALLPGIKPLVSAALGENFRPVPPVYQHTFVWLRPCISLNRPHYESICKYLEAEEAEDASLG